MELLSKIFLRTIVFHNNCQTNQCKQALFRKNIKPHPIKRNVFAMFWMKNSNSNGLVGTALHHGL